MPPPKNMLPWRSDEAETLAKRLPAYVVGRRWFRTKSSGISALRIVDALPLTARSALAVLEITSGNRTDRYALPLALESGARADQLERDASPLVIERLPGGALLCDALADPEALRVLLEGFRDPKPIVGERSMLELEASAETRAALSESAARFPPHPLGVEQSNSSIVYGERFILKLLRLLDEGESADLEMGRFLRQAGYAGTPRLEGSIRWQPQQGAASTLGILQAFVRNDGGAWERTLDRLAKLIAEHPEPPDDRSSEILASHRAWACELGLRTAELHRALGRSTGNPAFDPEPLTLVRQQQLAEGASVRLGESLRILRERKNQGGHISLPLWAGEVVSRLRAFGQKPLGGMTTRVHGDLHLGQILEAGADFVLIDFEGEPARPLSERRMKRSPLVDVAGILRSFHYAATTAARAAGGNRWESAWMGIWHQAVSSAFRSTYFEGMSGTNLLPANGADRNQALDFFLLEKCLYELGYELDNRPDWVAVPLAGLKELAGESPLETQP